MRLLKPAWVSHEGKPIFSIDIHPDGSRFATGGQGDDSGKVALWNMAPVKSEKDEKDENVPKLLCSMDNHLACVNCVRWSMNGKYLASGGDDKLIMIWQFFGRYPGSTSTVFGGKTVSIEQWRCVCTLRAHSGDVLDLAWSPHDAWLASCSIDNTIVIWNALKFPEVLSVLRGHTGLVKGITWDPVGKYVASQSDDRSLRVWRTLDWQQETAITKPFDECGGTTHVLRLSWSPDGHYIVSAHAMNNAGPTAQIIERDGWKVNMDFVGHRKAITCVRFNPNIFCKTFKKGGTGKTQQYSCCAIGSRDRSLSIWLTALKRPLVVTHDLFNNSILDISWSKGGFELLVCSWDGTVAYLDFTKEELGDRLSTDEKVKLHLKVYGNSLLSSDHSSYGNTIIETPAMLKIQQQKQEQNAQKATQQNSVSTPKKNIPIMEDGGKPNPLAKQIETRTADGRRRITPLCIAPQVDLGSVPEPFISTAFGSPTSLSEQNTDSTSNQGKTLESSIALPPSIQPMSALDSRLTSKSKPSTSAKSKSTTEKHKEKTKDGVHEKDRDKDKTKESSKARDKSASTTSTTSISVKRKTETTTLGTKRPRKDTLAKAAAAIATPVSSLSTTPDKESSRHAIIVSSTLQLPTPQPQKTLSLEILGRTNADQSTNIQLENNFTLAGVTVHRVKCHRAKQLAWESVLTSRGLAIAGNSNMVCVACEDKSLYIFSPSGRRLLPGLVLSSVISTLHCTGHFVMVITSTGNLHVWNVKKSRAIIREESLSPIMSGNDVTVSRSTLTDLGSPIITLSTGKTFTFNSELCCWTLLHHADDPLLQCSDYHSCLPSMQALQVSGPLASLQAPTQRPRQAAKMYNMNHNLQQAATLSHLENQVAAALTVKSNKEYRFWLMTYVRYLVQEGIENRLREICDELLGPFYRGDVEDSKWESHVLGITKRDMLQDILPMIGSNIKLQRLFTEYQEQLEMTRK